MKKLNNYPVLKFSIYYIIYFLIWLFLWKISPLINPPKETITLGGGKVIKSDLQFIIGLLVGLKIYLIPFLLTFIRVNINFFWKSVIHFLFLSNIINIIFISVFPSGIKISIDTILVWLLFDLSIFLICFIIKLIFVGRQP